MVLSQQLSRLKACWLFATTLAIWHCVRLNERVTSTRQSIRQSPWMPTELPTFGKLWESFTGQQIPMIAEFRELAAIKVTRPQVIKVMDIILPMPEEDASKRSLTIMENKRDSWTFTTIVTLKPKGMMTNMQGTALGLIQGFNTWNTHSKSVKGNRFGETSNEPFVAISVISTLRLCRHWLTS